MSLADVRYYRPGLPGFIGRHWLFLLSGLRHLLVLQACISYRLSRTFVTPISFNQQSFVFVRVHAEREPSAVDIVLSEWEAFDERIVHRTLLREAVQARQHAASSRIDRTAICA